MDANTEQSLELLATTNAQEFVKQFCAGINELKRDADGKRSYGATIEGMTDGYGDNADYTVDGISLECKVSDGGSEGDGEYVYRVFAVIKGGVEIAYFATNGYYASEYGITWDDTFTIVYPHQVVVTQYFKEK